MSTSKTAASRKKVDRVIATKRKELAAMDDEFFGEMAGVAEAIAALRTALNQVSAALDARLPDSHHVHVRCAERTTSLLSAACIAAE